MFELAIDEIERTNNIVGNATSFQDYLLRIDCGNKKTAQYLSINSISDLAKELRDSRCMIFRLGSPPGKRKTEFALAKVVNDWNDYFLIDKEIFEDIGVEDFTPRVNKNTLITFKLLPILTETSLVNLALASGLLSKALNIDQDHHQIIPATGRTVSTFDFQPASISSERLFHRGGQVEIDALLLGKRNGRECLFVIEAKSGKKLSSLAKHKLMYPMLAIQKSIPENIDIIPVYMRTVKHTGHTEFNIAECALPKINGVFGALDELVAKNVSRFSLCGY